MSTRSTILIVEDGINNVHVYTESFESKEIVYMESWYRDGDDTISDILRMPRALWDKLQREFRRIDK